MMSWFRRHRAKLLAVAVGMLMLSWGFGSYLTRSVGRRNDVAGWIHGKAVSHSELQEASDTLRVGYLLGFLEPNMHIGNGTPAATTAAAMLVMDFRAFALGEEGKLGDEAVWKCLVLLREAQAEGIAAAPVEVGELLALAPVCQGRNGFDRQMYAQALRHFGLRNADVIQSMGRLVSIAKLLESHTEGIRAPLSEVWARYYYENEKLKLRFVDIDASLFLPLVDYDPTDLTKWYDDHVKQVADPAAGVVGYMAPRRAKVGCAQVPMAKLQEQAVVTDEEVSTYYDSNKAFYRVRPAESQDKPADKEPQYKPLADVRDGIVQTLKRQKALKAADELVDSVMNELSAVASDYVNEPLPLAQMARRHGLDYRVLSADGGREFVSREELKALVPDGEAAAAFVFDETDNLYNPQQFASSTEPIICQVLALREPAPQSYEEVEAQVRHDYGLHEALQSAQKFAEKLRDAAEAKGLADAAAEMDAPLKAVVGETDKEGPLLEVKESEEFQRSASSIEGVPDSNAGLVEAAFALGPGKIGVAAGTPPAGACHVFEVTDREAPKEIEPGFMGLRFRLYYLLDKQRREVRRWLDGLVADSKRIERAKEE